MAATGFAGCLGRDGQLATGDPPQTATRTTGPGPSYTPLTATDGDVRARFRVVDAHAPTEEAASATFGDGRVVVTGSMDPGGCRRPTLGSVSRGSDAVELVVAEAWRFGPTATVECGNASYDYRLEVTAAEELPATVVVVHDHRDGEDRTFTLTP